MNNLHNNMSVFSNFLSPYIEAGLMQDVDQTKPSEVYAQLSIAYNQGSIGVKHNTRLFVPYYEQSPNDFDDDLYNKVHRNEHLMKLISWFNSKFIPEMPSMSYLTIQVRVRIFVSKLNKLVDENLVDKEVAIKVHLNLVDTIKEEYISLVNEDLPF